MAVSKAVQWIAKDLNEYADADAKDERLPNHSPSSPGFWFVGLAQETANGWKVPAAAALLNENARAKLVEMGIAVAA